MRARQGELFGIANLLKYTPDEVGTVSGGAPEGARAPRTKHPSAGAMVQQCVGRARRGLPRPMRPLAGVGRLL